MIKNTSQQKWKERGCFPGKEIVTFFQPIISIKNKRIVALEALSRYRSSREEDLHSISDLLRTMNNPEDLLRLDWQMIRTAVESFICLKCDPNTLLFINISSAFVQKGVESVEALVEFLEKAGLSSRRIVLEILEDGLEMGEDEQSFFQYCRKVSFLLALDDVGVGFSNLERIALIRPDIIKLDRSLVQEFHKDYYKIKVLESLVRLANDIGAIALAEGVENRQEVQKSLELGVSLVQGFYFCRPHPSFEVIEGISQNKILHERNRFKKQLMANRKRGRSRIWLIEKTVEAICRELVLTELIKMEEILSVYIQDAEGIECLFILDRDGILVTDTITVFKEYQKKHFLFQPAQKGSDLSLKPYFFEPDGVQRQQISSPYISQASGSPCITISKAFKSNGDDYLLCADFPD